MKKAMVAVLALSMLFCSVAVFAEAAPTEYVVQSVTGKVEREVSAGKFEVIAVGIKLASSSVINTGLNSSLVVKAGDKVVTIKALQKGTLDVLAGAAGTSKGIKLGAKAATTDVTAEGGQTRTNVSTASTRASDATKDIEWQTE
jgi:uncharacterized protein YbbC (DUF1343 family)